MKIDVKKYAKLHTFFYFLRKNKSNKYNESNNK